MNYNIQEIPIVSIICDVYNHEPYLRDCLNGFVMQETDFLYEILIHDDASTDLSQQIIREFTANYPNLFKPIFQEKNLYSQGIGIWKTIQFPRAKGKYLAFCEGDDYWIDPHKLQKQVDFLETHPKCAAVFGNIIVREETKDSTIYNKSNMESRYYTQKDMLRGLLFPLASICIRHDVINTWDNSLNANGDIILAYTSTLNGDVFMLADYMSVYRKTGKGVCTSKSQSEQLIAELSEWYNFHKQIGFPSQQTLIFHQSQSLFHYFLKNKINTIPYRTIMKYIRLRYLYLYIYYIIVLGIKHLDAICHTR